MGWIWSRGYHYMGCGDLWWRICVRDGLCCGILVGWLDLVLEGGLWWRVYAIWGGWVNGSREDE